MQILSYEPIECEQWVLTSEGQFICDNGSHEVRVFNAIPEAGMSVSDLTVQFVCMNHDDLIHFSWQTHLGAETAKLGQNTAFKKGWIGLVNGLLMKKVSSVLDEVQQELIIISKTKHHPSSDILKELKRRKLIDLV